MIDVVIITTFPNLVADIFQELKDRICLKNKNFIVHKNFFVYNHANVIEDLNNGVRYIVVVFSNITPLQGRNIDVALLPTCLKNGRMHTSVILPALASGMGKVIFYD